MVICDPPKVVRLDTLRSSCTQRHLWGFELLTFEKGSDGIAGMGVCVDDVLASVRGVVDLSPHEALDEAQDFLTRQGYSVTYRTSSTLTVKRQISDNATGQESIFKLIVMALPQSGGGVRIKVRGNDRQAVRDDQAAWLEWSETLPKREPEQPEAAATMESDTREIVGQEAPRPMTAADNDVPQRRYCSNCGQELRLDGRFCPSCGQPVSSIAQPPTSEPAAPTPQQQSSPQRKWGAGRVLMLVIVAPVLLAIAWYVFQFAVGFLNGFLNGLLGG
jgi:hypothetical protein